MIPNDLDLPVDEYVPLRNDEPPFGDVHCSTAAKGESPLFCFQRPLKQGAVRVLSRLSYTTL
jgi:hypothetical protein